MRSVIRTLRSRKGQSTVEAAFAIPILFLLMLLLLQPSILLYDRIIMQGAASEGCRLLATSSAPGKNEDDFIRRRLSAIPQTNIFHVHGAQCSWNIDFQGSEKTDQVAVGISTEVKPIPLIGFGMKALGLTNPQGNVVIQVKATAATQDMWVSQSGTHNPAEWVR